MTEAPFTEFSLSATFYVVSSVGGPQTGSIIGLLISKQSFLQQLLKTHRLHIYSLCINTQIYKLNTNVKYDINLDNSINKYLPHIVLYTSTDTHWIAQTTAESVEHTKLKKKISYGIYFATSAERY